MKEQILQCLRLTLISDSNTIKAATSRLSQFAQQPNYCRTVMEIADDQALEVGLRQSALVQFKNTIKKYWNGKDYFISQAQKVEILNVIYTAFVRSSGNYMLLKQYKDIICILINFVHKQWLPIETICNNLQNQSNPIPTLHFLIAIQSNFELSIHDEERDVFYNLLKIVLPVIWGVYQRFSNNSQVIYLIMKIIWKIVHYQVSHETRVILCNWMDLILNVAGATNPQLESNFDDIQSKGTIQFFYFHAKKWATKIIYRFIYRHANPGGSLLATTQVQQTNKQFSKSWYEAYGSRVVETIVNQLSQVPSIHKTRYFQLKCLTGLINHQPQSMRKYSEIFQYQVLPKYLQLKPQDQQSANNDPIQFINREQDLSISDTNLKGEAKQAWIAFTNIGAKRKKKGKSEQIGVLFNDNMNFLKSKLEGNNPLQKQMAMYLICNLRSSIKNCDQVKSIIPALISNYVVPLFTSEIMFLRARSMQIFDEYGDLVADKTILKRSVEGIYFCLTQDNFPLVRLQAATAFHVLLQHSEAKQEVKPLFKQILEIYLLLMEKYDSEKLVFSLSGIIEHFSLEVSPYACQLMKYLSKLFIKLYNKDKNLSQNPDYDGETQMAASGVINSMKTLLESPIQKQSIVKMEEDVLGICEQIFCSDDVDYIEDAISVLRAYTHRAPAITQRLLFFYVLLIYYVTGIQQSLWPKIDMMQIPETNKKCLKAVKSGCNIQTLDSVMLVLRNYITLNTQVLMQLNDPFGVNLLGLIFTMVNQIYKKGPSQYNGQTQMNSCTILMAYLLENNHKKWDDNMLNHIWQVAKANLLKTRSKTLKAINAQLLCLFLWNNSYKTISLAQSQNLLSKMCQCILGSEGKIKEEHQRQRLILGISELIALNNKPQQLMKYLPKLFNFVVALVKKNCQFRLNDENSEHYQTQSEDSQQLNDLLLLDGQDEPEDIWDQDFQHNYSSKLDEIDQVKHFKQSIQRLKTQQPGFYSQLIGLIPVDELSNLDQKINKAIDLTQQN